MKQLFFKKLFLLAGFATLIVALCIPVYALTRQKPKSPIVISRAFAEAISPESPISVEESSFTVLGHAKPAAAPKIQNPPASVSHVIGKPARLLIPSIGVDAHVEHIGLTPEGAVGVPDGGRNVSWFTQGARPGQKGSAVISGHYGIWRNSTNSVFNLLHTLSPGSSIYVKDDAGNTREFIVEKMKVYGKDDTVPEIFHPNDQAYLNIITCHGTWLPSLQTYNQRLVVFARLK